jgi:hypothetical protein
MPDPTPSPPSDWQERALAAEAATAQLQTKLDELTTTLAQTERRRQIDVELAHAQTIDIEAARLLTESALAQSKSPDIPKAIADLKKHKPFLFRPARPQVSAMSAAGKPAPQDELTQIADHARATGDKRALLQYLRARRTHQPLRLSVPGSFFLFPRSIP